MGNAGDMMPVRVHTHLLAWPHDLAFLNFCWNQTTKASDLFGKSREDQGGPVLLLQ